MSQGIFWSRSKSPTLGLLGVIKSLFLFNKRSPKDAAKETDFFAYVNSYFLKMKCKPAKKETLTEQKPTCRNLSAFKNGRKM